MCVGSEKFFEGLAENNILCFLLKSWILPGRRVQMGPTMVGIVNYPNMNAIGGLSLLTEVPENNVGNFCDLKLIGFEKRIKIGFVSYL